MPSRKKQTTANAPSMDEQLELCWLERQAQLRAAEELNHLREEGARDAKLDRAAQWRHRHCKGNTCIVGTPRRRGLVALRNTKATGRTARAITSAMMPTITPDATFMSVDPGDTTDFHGLTAKGIAKFVRP